MRLYLSGPMSGIPKYNFPNFESAAAALRAQGHTVVSPAEHDMEVWPDIKTDPRFAAGQPLTPAEYEKVMGWDLRVCAAERTSGIALLPGWENSGGAQKELFVIKACGKQVRYLVRDIGRDWTLVKDDPHKPKVIGLTGFAQAGKDTVGGILVQSFGFERLAFADPLRESLYALNPIVRNGNDIMRYASLIDGHGYEAAKKWPEVRKLLQRLGTEAGRDVLGQDVWTRALEAKVKPGGKYVITDVRFQNEADVVHKLGGEVWRIDRPGYGPVNAHASDAGLPDESIDWVIKNAAAIQSLAYSIGAAMQHKALVLS